MAKQMTLANGEKIRGLREGAGMTQEKLAVMSRVDRRTIQRAERGARLQMETLSSLAATLSVPVSQIIVTDVPRDEIDELKAKSLVVLNRVQSGITLLNIVRDSYEGAISCEADPTPENIDALTAIVSKLEELMPRPWAGPGETIQFPLSERLRTAVAFGDHLKQLEAQDVAFFAGTYTARTQIPRYDPETGEMYTTSRTPFELVTMCRIIVAPASRGERVTVKANDIYVAPQPPAEPPESPFGQVDEEDEVPF
jgi:transcriptional regulator with XRE-family HTH domain